MPMGLNKATDVLLTGCSAGGLATYLHADHVASLLRWDLSTIPTTAVVEAA